MLARFLLVLGFALMIFASLFYLQAEHSFYFMQKPSWLWLLSYIKDYKTLPDFITRQFFIIGCLMPIYWLVLVISFNRNKTKTLYGKQGQNNLHGSAHFAKWSDVKNAGLAGNKGVVVGGYKSFFKTKMLHHDGAEHILCFAPTRSGKGIGLVLPTLLTWQHSILVLDIKGENYHKTAGYRKSIGQRVLKFDPTAESGSIRFNPLEEVRLGTDFEIEDAQNVASMVIDPEGKGLKDFWLKSGFGWLTAGILYTLYKVREESQDKTASLYDVSLKMSSKDLEKLLDEMIAFEPKFNDEIRLDVKNLINSEAQAMKDKAPPERSGVHSSATVELKLYSDPIIAKNISKSDFRLSDLIDKENPVSLYLIIPPSSIDRLRPLLRVVMNITLRRLMNVLPKGETGRLLLMLDEFTSIGKLEIFERALAFMAGYGLKAYIIVQDLSQLQQAYGKEESIMSNCHIRIAYAPNKIETAKVLSDMSGQTTIVQEKTSINGKVTDLVANYSSNIYETIRPLLTPDECMQLRGAIKSKLNPSKVVKGGDMLIFPAGFAPIMGRQILYFKDKELLRRSELKIPEEIFLEDVTKKQKAPEIELSQLDIKKQIIGNL